MGTNYYVVINKCECCNRHDKIHIGKQSVGWQFTFHGPVDEFPELRSWKNWKSFLENKIIKNEYEEIVSFKDFVLMIEKSVDGKSHFDYCSKTIHYWRNLVDDDLEWKDEEGWSFSTSEFS